MNLPNDKLFPDLGKIQRDNHDLMGIKQEQDAHLLRDLFRHGQRHVSLYEWTHLIHGCSCETVGHFILKSIRCLLCGMISSDHEVNSLILPFYLSAKKFVETDGEGQDKLLMLLGKTLEVYQGRAEPTSYVLDGIQWHRLAHLVIATRNGIDYLDIESQYDVALEEIVARRRT